MPCNSPCLDIVNLGCLFWMDLSFLYIIEANVPRYRSNIRMKHGLLDMMLRCMHNNEKKHGIGHLTVKPNRFIKRKQSDSGSNPPQNVSAHRLPVLAVWGCSVPPLSSIRHSCHLIANNLTRGRRKKTVSSSGTEDAAMDPSFSRKWLDWIAEEDHFLVKLRQEEKLSWSEAIGWFDKNFPGGARGTLRCIGIRVYVNHADP